MLKGNGYYDTWENKHFRFATRSDTNQPVEAGYMYKLEISDLGRSGNAPFDYSCSENKGADQLRSYRSAPLFSRICKMLVYLILF